MPKTTSDKDSADIVTFEAGQYVFLKGEDSRELYIVQEGEVELLAGEGTTPLLRIGPGEPFGELSMLEQAPREGSARAVSASRLVKIDPDAYAELMKDPAVVVPMLRRLSRRVGAAFVAGASKAPVAAKELKNPRLIHGATGKEFPLPASGEAVVGRADPKSGFQPEVELSGCDPKRSLSRKHARVLVHEGQVSVVEEPKVSNGTFVNGTRLKSGAPVKIASGDKVHFGLVEMVFQAD